MTVWTLERLIFLLSSTRRPNHLLVIQKQSTMTKKAIVIDALFFFFQAEDGIRDYKVTGVQTCALPISGTAGPRTAAGTRALRSRRASAAIPATRGSRARPGAAARSIPTCAQLTGTAGSNGLLKYCAPISNHSDNKRSSAGLSQPACVLPEPVAKRFRNWADSPPFALPAFRYGPTEVVTPILTMLCGNSSCRYEVNSCGTSLEAELVRSRLPAGVCAAPAAFFGLWQPACEQP